MSSVAEFEEELKREYSKKTNHINRLLREIDPDSKVEYNMIDLDVSSKSSILKCKVTDSDSNPRIIGLEAVDRRLKALGNQVKLQGFKGKAENDGSKKKGVKAENFLRSENESNKILFDTIQLIDKLRSQYEILK